MKAEDFLDETKQVILNHRMDYADPKEVFTMIAKRWSDILDVEIEPEDVALMMIDLKIVRLLFNPDCRDSIRDIAGYAACLEEVRLPDPPKEVID